MLKKDVEAEQLCYYQTGVGTYENPGIFTPIALWVAQIMDEAVAWLVLSITMASLDLVRVVTDVCHSL